MERQREEAVVPETIVEQFGDEAAAAPQPEAGDKRKHDVTIKLSSGADHSFAYRGDELVGKLLADAVKYFGDHKQLDPNGQYKLVSNGSDLNVAQTLDQAGVKPGDVLLLTTQAKPTDG